MVFLHSLLSSRILGLCFFAALSFMLSGCGSQYFSLKQTVSPTSLPEHERILERAEYAMLQGRHSQAEKAYFELLEKTDSPPLKRRARYGLASLALLSAQSDQDFTQGVRLLEEWAQNVSDPAPPEDPRFLLPVLREHEAKLQELQAASNELARCQQRMETYHEKYVCIHRELVETEKELETSKAEIRKLQEKIESLEKLYNDLLDKRKNL